jgi:E3 ubiquitin-protein ligase RNF14
MGDHGEELEMLQIIYPELEITDEETAHIELPITLTDPLQICVECATQTHHAITYLPPISIEFRLPKDYPLHAPPLVKLSSTAFWLSADLAKNLQATVATLWEEYGHCQILFTYISHIQEAAENNFGLSQLAVSSDCFDNLVAYDRQTAREEFKKGSYSCTICLDPKSGHKCYRMERCRHIFCTECLQSYYNAAIESGDVDNIQCLSPNCGTENMDVRDRRAMKVQHISPRELLQIPLDRKVVQRYVDMKRKKRLEADKSTVWCPRKWCQGAAKGNKYPKSTSPIDEMNESDTEDEKAIIPASTYKPLILLLPKETQEEQKARLQHVQRLSICEDCGFAFCKICHLGWHGELIWCYPVPEAIPPTPKFIKEDQASLDYIATHTSPCPACWAPVSKTEACNHIICTMCRAHFCYLCSEELDPRDTYTHFNMPATPCFQRLWVLEDGGEELEEIFTHGLRRMEIAAREYEEARQQAEAQQREQTEQHLNTEASDHVLS